MSATIELEPLNKRASISNDAGPGTNRTRPVGVFALAVLIVGAFGVAAWSNGNSQVAGTAKQSKVESGHESHVEWRQCVVRLSKRADKCLTDDFPKTESARLFTVDETSGMEQEQKLSASAVRHALPEFSCTKQHKVSMVDDKTIAFVYTDNTLVAVDSDLCEVKAVYAPRKTGQAHPVASELVKKSSGEWNDNAACSTETAGDEETNKKSKKLSVAADCHAGGSFCWFPSLCCSRQCGSASAGFGVSTCLLTVGQTCWMGANCAGFNWDKPNSVQCCNWRCQYNYPYPGQTSGVCGPRTTSVVISDVGQKYHMDLASYNVGTKVTLYHAGGNKRWFIFHTDRWRYVQLSSPSDRYWTVASHNGIKFLQLGAFIKGDCNMLFKLESRGGGKYVIKNKCQEHCLDLRSGALHDEVVVVACHYRTSQLWTLG